MTPERCAFCWQPASEMHHVLHRSQGGTDENQNLLPLCRRCHDGHHTGTWEIGADERVAWRVHRETGERVEMPRHPSPHILTDGSFLDFVRQIRNLDEQGLQYYYTGVYNLRNDFKFRMWALAACLKGMMSGLRTDWAQEASRILGESAVRCREYARYWHEHFGWDFHAVEVPEQVGETISIRWDLLKELGHGIAEVVAKQQALPVTEAIEIAVAMRAENPEVPAQAVARELLPLDQRKPKHAWGRCGHCGHLGSVTLYKWGLDEPL